MARTKLALSPGTFYGGISITDIQADNYNCRSSLRNKLVAEGFYLVNAIEKYGSGFIRIRKAIQEAVQGLVATELCANLHDSQGTSANVAKSALMNPMRSKAVEQKTLFCRCGW